MIDAGGRRIHCVAYGSGSPTVVLVSGLESPQEYWNSVIPDLAAKTTVVTFDRAGIGKSEIGDLPTHGEHTAKDLRVRNVTREQVKESKLLPRVPPVILTCADRASAMQPLFSDGAIEELAKLDLALMNKLAASIPGGRQIMIEGTGHNVHVDKPEALIVPLLEMIKEVQEKTRKGLDRRV
jgi:pimeloyl-ACP methyl ester carboxylesterase